MLGRLGHVELERRPGLARRFVAALTLLVLTLAAAGLLAAGIYEGLRTLR